MTEPEHQSPRHDLSPAPAEAAPTVPLSRAEFLWITFGVWLGGVFMLTILPILLIPRLGMPLGVAASYFVFFVAWQPVQTITQRTLGVRAAVVRMVLFVGAAATLAFYLREALLGMQ
jgi:hypothetical protein